MLSVQCPLKITVGGYRADFCRFSTADSICTLCICKNFCIVFPENLIVAPFFPRMLSQLHETLRHIICSQMSSTGLYPEPTSSGLFIPLCTLGFSTSWVLQTPPLSSASRDLPNLCIVPFRLLSLVSSRVNFSSSVQASSY
jgi:hypothetical protein